MRNNICPHCVNGMLNEAEPCPYTEYHVINIIISDELFEVSDNDNYVENTEQKF